MASTKAIATRAHEFIAQVAQILTDEPEIAALKIGEMFAEQGEQLDADAKELAAPA